MGKKDRDEIVKMADKDNKHSVVALRTIAYILLYGSIYMILSSIIPILGTIPLVGDAKGLKLIVMSSIISLIVYLLIVSISWMFTKPYSSMLLLAMIFILVIGIKIFNEYVKLINEEGKPKKLANRIMMEESNFLDY